MTSRRFPSPDSWNEWLVYMGNHTANGRTFQIVRPSIFIYIYMISLDDYHYISKSESAAHGVSS